MKKIIVLFFLVGSALGQWQQSDEITLPKGLQVSDLTINSSGELWVLSTSSISKYEKAAKDPFRIQDMSYGRALTVIDNEIYVIDNTSRLINLAVTNEGLTTSGYLAFNTPNQIESALINTKPIVIVKEPNKLIFTDSKTLIGSINTIADRFSVIPAADYGNTDTPLFTLYKNRIYAWTGGTFAEPMNYQKKIVYSASHNILDFNTDRDGNLFVLFADSIVVLEPDGTFQNRINIANVSLGSRILNNPANNTIVIYNNAQKTLKTISGMLKSNKEDLITLHNNHPNPVDNYTEIEFTLNQFLDISITIYNLIGEPVKVIARGRYPKGTHRVTWNAIDERGNLVPNGVYFYRLESKKGVAIRQLTVLR